VNASGGQVLEYGGHVRRRRVTPVVMPQTMMPQFEILERSGIGPVRLGMTRSQVRDALAHFPDSGLDQDSHPTLDYAFGNSLQIEYDDAGHAQFIGAGFYKGCGCDYMFRDRHVGEYGANELFRVLAEIDGGSHDFNEYDYFFPNIMMTVWDADSQYDYLGGESRAVYGQIGVANQTYCDAAER
jgi:hypothetical protein